MIVHELEGCAPTPLAFYLKALGVLRLVAEQLDQEARGWWEGERFYLATHKDRDEIEDFFLKDYRPTPLVAPWLKGSGFFYADDPAINAFERSTAARFSLLRTGISAARQPLARLAVADQQVRAVKAESKEKNLSSAQKKAIRASEDYKKRLSAAEKQFKAVKGELIPSLRLSWRGPHLQWMDAAMVLTESGDPQYPALLGTGGNDGRLDFTNNFLQRLTELFDVNSPEGGPLIPARAAFDIALWRKAIQSLMSGPSGQFLPGNAGGANSSNGPEGRGGINPADFVLALEGAVLFTSLATRRLGTTSSTRAASPFTLSSHAAGYASASESDENARGEQWMPLWSQPLTLRELGHLLGEGRAQIGTKFAREPLDLARAVARLGTARGIIAFQRFGYIERYGQSNLAVPLGRIRVPDRAVPRLACLDDLDAWLPRLRLQARDTKTRKAPGSLKHAERRLADALFEVVQHADEPLRWQAVLMALADVETIMTTGAGIAAGPIPALRPEWVSAADDRSAEFRLALACALQAWAFLLDGRAIRPVRAHWLPLDAHGRRFELTGTGSQRHLVHDPRVVIRGRRGEDDAIALLERRMIEAARAGQRSLPLRAAPRASASPYDLGRLTYGQVDLDRTLALARSLMALDRSAWTTSDVRPMPAQKDGLPDDAWIAVRLAALPWPLRERRHIGTDPAMLRRLTAGDAGGAVQLALRRLRGAGIRTALSGSTADSQTARRWAAALAFPITHTTAARFLRRIELIKTGETA